MNDKLLRDVGIVFLVWFVILYGLSGFPLSFAPAAISGSLLIWVIGIGAGGCIAWMFAYGSVENDRRNVTGKDFHETATASIMDADEDKTLYQVRLPKPEPVTVAKGKTVSPLHAETWWETYSKKYPDYARFLNDVFALMQTKPDLPAGYKGGHGKTTLVEHSLGVVHAMFSVAPKWHFEGIKGRNGQITVPLLDGTGEDASVGKGTPEDCPLLPVLAFAHDIGKVECFIQDDDGSITEVIPGHGRRGAALLRRLPSLWSLPEQDRDALLLAVEFYHGLSQMPVLRWVGDRARSLTALLYLADCEASAREGYKPEAAVEAREMYLAKIELQSPDGRHNAVAGPITRTQTAEEEQEQEIADNASNVYAQTSSEGTAANESDGKAIEEVTLTNGATLMDALIETLRAPDAINGKNTDRRIAFKYGGWVFVMARAFGDAFMRFSGEKFSNEYRGQLFGAIDDQEGLLTEVAGTRRKPATALWELVLARPGDGIEAPPAYPGFVFRTHLIPGLDSFKDCAFCPAIKVAGNLVRIEAGQNEIAGEQGEPGGSAKGGEGFGDIHPDLTAGILQRLAGLEEDTHGRLIKKSEKTGAKAALFRFDSLSESYSIDQTQLPEGVISLKGKGGTVYLGVVLCE